MLWFPLPHQWRVDHRMKKLKPHVCTRKCITFYEKAAERHLGGPYTLPGWAKLMTSSFYLIVQKELTFLSIS